ncbi:GNAT family N-acetyltransferase [Shewanella frigidimarina]|uniref:GNAT family N-acetyltransferase n=1 Tax=Shewanella frigidimarina TaxID=56812 RepID=UPI001404F408
MHLVDLVCAPEARSKGICSAVLEALKYDTKVRQVPICLSVALDNPRAKALYLRQGFNLIGVSDTHGSM